MPAMLVLPRPGGPANEDVVGRLAALLGRLEHDGQVLFQLALTDELGQASWPQSDVVDLIIVGDRVGVEELVTHAWLRAA